MSVVVVTFVGQLCNLQIPCGRTIDDVSRRARWALILSRLRQRRSQQTADRSVSAADLAAFFNEPEPRIHERLRALADQGLIKESSAAPQRWMIALASDPGDL